MEDRKHHLFGKSGIIRLIFDYGSEEWTFGYVTIYFIQQFYVGRTLHEGDQKQIGLLHNLRVFDLCAEAERARINQANINIDPAQTLIFARMADDIAHLLVELDSETFTSMYLDHMKVKFDRFDTVKDFEQFYLPHATVFLDSFNTHYEGVDIGKKILENIGFDRKTSR